MNSQFSDNDQNPTKIEQDIVETRNRMDGTLDRLAAKADPSDLIDSIYQWGRRKIDGLDSGSSSDSLKSAAHEAGRLVKENPVPIALGLAAIGSTFFANHSSSADSAENEGKIANLKSSASEKLHDYKDAAAEKAHDLKETLATKTEAIRDKVSQSTSEIRDTTGGQVQNASSHLSDAAQKTSDKVSELGDAVSGRFKSTKEDNPLPLCAGILVSGFVLGLLLPKSRQEEKIYGAAADTAKAKLVEKSRAIADNAKAKLSEKRLDRQGLTARTENAIDEYGNRLEEHLHQS